MSRVLVVANDVVALQMAGPGIRCVELSRALAQAGHDVTLIGLGSVDLEGTPFRVIAPPGAAEFDSLSRAHDVIILEGISLVRYPALRAVPVPLVIDLYDPFPIALLGQEAYRAMPEQETEHQQILAVFRDLVHLGDFFICANEAQRDLWSGALLDAGRINPRTWRDDNSLRKLIDVVPFGLPAVRPPSRAEPRDLPVGEITADDVVMLWGGGIYNWFDPLTLIRAVGQLADNEPRVKLLFMSTTHPNPAIPQRMWMPGRARALSDELGLTGRNVFFNEDWVPYGDRGRWLTSADCGVSTHFANAETHFAFRTRILDYLWAGLPIICTDGDHFARQVSSQEWGWTVPPENVDALSEAIASMARDPTRRRDVAARVQADAAAMTWDRVAEPLIRFVAHPVRAPDDPRAANLREAPPRPLKLHASGWWALLRRGVIQLRRTGPSGTWRQFRAWRRRRLPPSRGARE